MDKRPIIISLPIGDAIVNMTVGEAYRFFTQLSILFNYHNNINIEDIFPLEYVDE